MFVGCLDRGLCVLGRCVLGLPRGVWHVLGLPRGVCRWAATAGLSAMWADASTESLPNSVFQWLTDAWIDDRGDRSVFRGKVQGIHCDLEVGEYLRRCLGFDFEGAVSQSELRNFKAPPASSFLARFPRAKPGHTRMLLIDNCRVGMKWALQTVVFCLVEIYIVLGKSFVLYLRSLSSTHPRLVTIYANRISQVGMGSVSQPTQ